MGSQKEFPIVDPLTVTMSGQKKKNRKIKVTDVNKTRIYFSF